MIGSILRWQIVPSFRICTLFLQWFWISLVPSLSHVPLFVTRTLQVQHARLPCPSPTLELVQTHVHPVSDAIQPSHPLSCPSPPSFNLSQHQGLFQWVSSSYQVAKVLKFQLQQQFFQWISRTDFLLRIDWFDLLAVLGTLKSLLQHHNWSSSHVHTWLLEKP